MKARWVLTVLALAGVSLQAQQSILRFSTRATARAGTGQVTVVSQDHIWVGLNLTEDGGRTWFQRVPPPDEPDFNPPPSRWSTHFVDNKRGWVGGANRVWATTDSGHTWSPAFSGRMLAIAFSGPRGWMAVRENQQHHVRNLVSTDAGLSWQQCGKDWNPRVVAPGPWDVVSFVEGGRGWLIVARYDADERSGRRGVATTTDGGCTWKVIWWNREGDNLATIQFVDSRHGWLASSGYDRLLETSDGGVHWKTVASPYREIAGEFSYDSVYMTAAGHGWALGNPGGLLPDTESGIFFTADGGIHWQSLSKMDIRENRGLARDLPSSWGDGFLVKAYIAQSVAESEKKK